MRYVGYAVTALIAIVLLMVVGSALGIFGNFLQVGDRVSDRAQFSYEEFYDKCHSVRSLENQEQQLQDQLDRTNPEDQDEINRINSSLTGVRARRAQVIEEYNSNASKWTRNLFQANDLPERLGTERESTTCAR